jgi:hypothetical protein
VIERRQHPQHEGAEEIGLILDVLEFQNTYQPLPVPHLHEVVNVEFRLAEEQLRPLLLELDHVA